MRLAALSRFAVIFALVAAVAVLAGCGSSSDDTSSGSTGGSSSPEEIKIAAPVELSGPIGSAGKQWLNYLEFGVEQVNSSGGIKSLGGAKLKLLVADTKSESTTAPALLRDMVSEGAVIDVGPLSGGLTELKPTLISLGIPWVGVAAEPSLTEGGSEGTMWRIVGGAEAYAKGAFEFLEEQQEAGKIDLKKIGILSATSPPSPEYKAAIEKFAAENGWETVNYNYDFTKQRDYNSFVSELHNENVDLVMGQSFPPDSIGIAEAFQLQSWRPKAGFLWLDGFQVYNEFREAAGDDVTGWLAASNLAPESSCEMENELSKAYEKQHGVPIAGSAGGGVSVIGVIADALERAGSTDSDELKKALGSTKLKYCEGLYGQLGGVSFNADGNNEAFEPTILQLEGKFGQVAVAPAEAKTGEAKWPAN